MKTNLCCILFFTAIIFSTNSVYSQEDLSTDSLHLKNAINGSLGFGLLGGTINVGYSRLLAETNKKFFTSYWIGVDVGRMYIYGDNYRYLDMDLTAFTGSGKNHFELSVGIAIMKEINNYTPLLRTIGIPVNESTLVTGCFSLGYRLQKPDRKFFFKTGIGFPEFLHVGLGTRF